MSFIYSCCVPTKSFYLILSGVGTRHVLNMDSYNSPPVNSPTGIQSHTTKKTQTYAYKLPAEWMCAWYSYPPRIWVCVSMFFSFIHSMYDGYATVLRYESVKSKECNTIKTRHRRAVLKPVSRSVFGCFHCCRTAATKYHADFTLARVNCDRLRSSLDCSIESGKKKCECNSFCVSPARMVVTCLLGSSWTDDKENGFVAAYPTYDNEGK